MTTLLARRAQFHQFRLSEQVTPFDYHYQIGMHKAAAVLGANGPAGTHNLAAQGLIYQQMVRQANLFSFTDAFYFSTIILLCVIPLVLFLKRPKNAIITVGVH